MRQVLAGLTYEAYDLTIVHGGARGPDTQAGLMLADDAKIEVFPADWDGLGRSAGYMRNMEMLDSNVDRVIAFWDGKSRGTKHTINEAWRRGIPVRIYMERDGNSDTE